MPITIHNGLPCINLTLGPLEDLSAVNLTVLWGCCAALNSGNLQFNYWIMRQYRHLVSKFIMFDDKNPFEPINLSGVDTNPDNYNFDTHGQLTGIFRYVTPYHNQYNQPITISFGLGENIAINSIISWLAILDMDIDLSVWITSIISHTFQSNLSITCRKSTLGTHLGIPLTPPHFSASNMHNQLPHWLHMLLHHLGSMILYRELLIISLRVLVVVTSPLIHTLTT